MDRGVHEMPFTTNQAGLIGHFGRHRLNDLERCFSCTVIKEQEGHWVYCSRGPIWISGCVPEPLALTADQRLAPKVILEVSDAVPSPLRRRSRGEHLHDADGAVGVHEEAGTGPPAEDGEGEGGG